MAKQLEDAFRQALLGPASAGVLSATAERKSYGPYEAVASIGRGGMGEIYMARRKDSGPDVRFLALKVLSEEVESDEEIIAMFLDEASIMAQIDHKNVLRVFDSGTEQSAHYLAMEYLAGRPLVRVMIDAFAGGKGLSYAAVAAIGIGSARGLEAAHRAKTKAGAPLDVIHRDISPQNIFITYDGEPKVIDFGVARASERMAKTVAGQLKGKAAYMSPEQVTGKQIDQRTDVFSLGACLWEMTAGRRLFRRQSDFDTMVAVTEGPIVSPTGLRGDVDRELDAVILGALARDREKRTQTGEELQRNLVQYAERRRFPTDGTALRELMGVLYGREAREEAALMQSFRERFATEAEMYALRALSGIAPRPVRGELTIMGRSADLAELDDFGGAGGTTDSSEAVSPPIPPVFSGSKDDDEVRTVKYDASLHLAKFAAENTDEEVEEESLQTLTPESAPSPIAPSADPTEIGVRAPSVAPVAVIRDDEDTDDDTAGSVSLPLQALEAHVLERARSVNTSETPPQVRSQKLPPGLGMALFAAGSIVAGLGIAYLLAGRKAAPEPPPPVPEQQVEELVGAAPDPAPAPVAVAMTLEDVIKKSEGAISDAPAGTNGERRTLKDKQGGVLVVAADATIRPIHAASAWILSSTGKSVASVGWLGKTREGQWRVRPLSVNDCPATIRLEGNEIHIGYPAKNVVLPEGGGALGSLSFERPAFANRLELKTLGIAFGAADESRPGTLCGRGFGRDKVLVSRLPPGDYAFVWVGKDSKDQPVTSNVIVTVAVDGPETVEIAAPKR